MVYIFYQINYIFVFIFRYGPWHPKKSSVKFECEIEIELSFIDSSEKDSEKNLQIKRDLLQILSNMIIREEYPKSVITLSFDVIQKNGSLLHNLINLSCLALNMAEIKMFDFFSASLCVKKQNKKFIMIKFIRNLSKMKLLF